MDSHLQSLWLFSDCTARQLRTLGTLGTRRRVAAGSRLLVEGCPGGEVTLVLSGTAACTVGGKVIALFGVGDFFGEIATLDGGACTATVEAVTDMDVIVLQHHEFEKLLAISPSSAMRVLEVAARRLRHANDLATV